MFFFSSKMIVTVTETHRTPMIVNGAHRLHCYLWFSVPMMEQKTGNISTDVNLTYKVYGLIKPLFLLSYCT